MKIKPLLGLSLAASVAFFTTSCSLYRNTSESKNYKMYTIPWGPPDSTYTVIIHEFKYSLNTLSQSKNIETTFFDLNNDGIMDQADFFQQIKSNLSNEITASRYLRNQNQLPIDSGYLNKSKVISEYRGREAESFLNEEFIRLRRSSLNFKF